MLVSRRVVSHFKVNKIASRLKFKSRHLSATNLSLVYSQRVSLLGGNYFISSPNKLRSET